MQVQGVNLAQNNYSPNAHTNFTAVRSVKCDGLYKKHPELANELVEAFKQNPVAIEFCKKYDVDIVFNAIIKAENYVKSSVSIFFDNVSESKAEKFFRKLFGIRENKVVVESFGNEYPLSSCFKTSTKELVERILPEKDSAGGWHKGLLDIYLKSADKQMQEALDKGSKKSLKKAAKLVAEQVNESKIKNANFELQNSIKDLMNQSL